MDGFEHSPLTPLDAERLPAERPCRALEDEGKTEHDVVPRRIFHRRRVRNVRDAFIGGHTAADSENENGDDERPEVEFAPVTERMIEVRRLAAFVDTEQHQPAVARVNDGVNCLREHRRAAREKGGNELCLGNRQIA